MSGPPPLILGGGPAGAAAAIHLLRLGIQPVIVERQREPADALCGGFLSWRTLELLDAIGISRAMLRGSEVNRLRIVTGRREYSAALPKPALGLSRRRLDGLLLDHATEMGAVVRHGCARFEDGRIRLGDGETLEAESVFVATGKHDLRGLPRPREAAGADPMSGLRWRLAPHKALRALLSDHIEIHPFDRGYAGLVLHEDGSANFCMAVRKSRLAEAKGDPAALLAELADAAPILAARLAFLDDAARFDAIGHIPYHWRAATGVPGVFRLGDQAGVIASLAGEGIGIALASAAEAVAHWRKGGAAAAPLYQTRFSARLARPVRAARAVVALGQTPQGARLLAQCARVPGALAWMGQATRI